MKIIAPRAAVVDEGKSDFAIEMRAARFSLAPKICYAVVLLVGVLSYGLSLRADFYMDDYMHIVDSAFVKGESWELYSAFRTLPYLMYRGVYAMAGPSPVAFHFLNFSVHLGAACALVACGRLLLRRLNLLGSSENRAYAAFAGGLVFVAHPFASEAVNYARCTMIDLVTLFTILATWMALRWAERPNRRDAALFGTFVVLGTFSKEVGVIHVTFHVLLVALIAWNRAWIARARNAFRGPQGAKLKLALGVAVVPAACLVSYWVSRGYPRLTSPIMIDHTLTQGRMIWGYFTNMVVPHGLFADHQIAWSRSTSDTPALIGTLAMFVLFLAVTGWVAKKRTRGVGVLLAMVVFPLALRVLYPIHEHFVEYRAYPALPWFGLIVGVGLATIAQRHLKATQWALIAITLSGITFSVLRSAQWSSATILARQSIEKYPFNNRPRLRLQADANLCGNYTEALNLRKLVYANYVSTVAYNENNRWGREFDMGRANYDLVRCDQLAAYAIAETEGLEKALQFIDERLLLFRAYLGPFESEEAYLDAMEALTSVRNILRERDDSSSGLSLTSVE